MGMVGEIMAHTKTVAPNIKANIRDSGETISYSLRVSINAKDVCMTKGTLEEAIEARDKLLSKQYTAFKKRLKKVETLNFKQWGYL